LSHDRNMACIPYYHRDRSWPNGYEGGMARVVCGVGRVRFRLEYGGLLKVDGVLFVQGLRVNLLSVSSLEDVGYSTLFKREHVFIYREGVDPVEPQLIGDRMDKLYKL
jgi:hypothetical protein